MNGITEKIRIRLFRLQNLEYKKFICRLMPTVDPDTVIGVRAPQLRKLAKELSKASTPEEFLLDLPHKYYEENNLHGFLIETVRDYDAAISAMEAFLPYIDNWATCDSISPKVFKRHLPELYERILLWLKSDLTYTVRFGIRMLMNFYLDDNFRPDIPELVAQADCQDYYVNMMVAWYFATGLAKRYEEILPYIRERRLDKWTHNKAIEKAIESRRVDEEAKAYLRTLKI